MCQQSQHRHRKTVCVLIFFTLLLTTSFHILYVSVRASSFIKKEHSRKYYRVMVFCLHQVAWLLQTQIQAFLSTEFPFSLNFSIVLLEAGVFLWDCKRSIFGSFKQRFDSQMVGSNLKLQPDCSSSEGALEKSCSEPPWQTEMSPDRGSLKLDKRAGRLLEETVKDVTEMRIWLLSIKLNLPNGA